MWIHEENSLTADKSNLSDVTVRIRGVLHLGGKEWEIKDGNLNVQQQRSGGATENATNDNEASGDNPQSEEIDPSKIKWPDGDKKKPSKKGNGGAIPTTNKKTSNLNQSTPKTAQKGTLIQDRILVQFISEAKNMSQAIDRAIATLEKKKSVSMGKKTTANMKIMQTDILDKLYDINETWVDMENNGDGNQTTRSVLSRAVRSVAMTTNWAIRQNDEFQQEELTWRAKNRPEQKPMDWDKTKRGMQSNLWQAAQQLATTTVLPARSAYKHWDHADTKQIQPISGNNSVTPSINNNI